MAAHPSAPKRKESKRHSMSETPVQDTGECSDSWGSIDLNHNFFIVIPDPPETVRLGMRFVLIKVGDLYLRHNRTSHLVITKAKPPIVPPVPHGEMPGVLRQYPRRITKDFAFENYTFCMEENVVATKSHSIDIQSVQHQMHANFSILVGGHIFMLCARSFARGAVSVMLDPLVYGSEWRLHAMADDQYVMECVDKADYCLACNRFGLCLERMSPRDWVRLEKGVCPSNRRVTITNIPDFAVAAPGVRVH